MSRFTIELPAGFIALPAVTAATDIQRELAELCGLPASDPSAAKVAEFLSALGAIAADGGAEYTAVGLFRSADDPQRPVSVVLTASQVGSDHDDPGTVIAGLREVYGADPDTDVEVLQLPTGQALAAIREEPAMIRIEGVDPQVLLQRQVLGWIPDPAGSAVAMIGLASNSWPNWAHVCDLALDVFESICWDSSAPEQDPPGDHTATSR